MKWAKQQRLKTTAYKDFQKLDDINVDKEEQELIKYMKRQFKSVASDPKNKKCKNNIFSCIRFSFGFRRLFVSIFNKYLYI